MARWFRALSALAEDPVWFLALTQELKAPVTPLQFLGLQCSLLTLEGIRHTHGAHAHMQAQHSYTYNQYI